MAAGCDQEMTVEIELSVHKTCGPLSRQAEGFLSGGLERLVGEVTAGE
jgi:hypothetical protein